MTEPTESSNWRCFWFNGRTRQGVSCELAVQARPEPLEQIVARMRELLVHRDKSFVGIVDDRGVALQFAGQLDGQVMMDIPCADRGGSWSVKLTLLECCRRATALGEHGRVDVTNYSDLRFRRWPARKSSPSA